MTNLQIKHTKKNSNTTLNYKTLSTLFDNRLPQKKNKSQIPVSRLVWLQQKKKTPTNQLITRHKKQTKQKKHRIAKSLVRSQNIETQKTSHREIIIAKTSNRKNISNILPQNISHNHQVPTILPNSPLRTSIQSHKLSTNERKTRPFFPRTHTSQK